MTLIVIVPDYGRTDVCEGNQGALSVSPFGGQNACFVTPQTMHRTGKVSPPKEVEWW